MARILIADTLAQQGIDMLSKQHDVEVRTGLSEDELVEAVADINALVVRSQTQVTARVLEAGAEIMRLCVDAGGSITGEHGVGLEKRDFIGWIYSDADLAAMAALKRAFKAGDLYNPCKAFPTHRGCGEASQARIQRLQAMVGDDVYV